MRQGLPVWRGRCRGSIPTQAKVSMNAQEMFGFDRMRSEFGGALQEVERSGNSLVHNARRFFDRVLALGEFALRVPVPNCPEYSMFLSRYPMSVSPQGAPGRGLPDSAHNPRSDNEPASGRLHQAGLRPGCDFCFAGWQQVAPMEAGPPPDAPPIRHHHPTGAHATRTPILRQFPLPESQPQSIPQPATAPRR